jgi:hypothetical protein
MTNDDDFATHLRERIAVIAPDVNVDTSAVVPRGRRRRRTTGLASLAAVGVVLVGGGWVASAASTVNHPPAGESEQWTAPAWFAEQAAERAAFRDNLQECVDARGWQVTVNEWGGGSEFRFADQAEVDRFVADVEECSAALGRHGASGFDDSDDPDALTRYLYPMLVDTWECVVHQGYDVPPPPSEDELVRQYAGGAPDSGEPIWDPYGDLSKDGLMTVERMAELETTCPLPW